LLQKSSRPTKEHWSYVSIRSLAWHILVRHHIRRIDINMWHQKNRKEVIRLINSKYWFLPQRNIAEGKLTRHPLSKQQRSLIWCGPSGYSQLNPWKLYPHFSLQSEQTKGHAFSLVN
jgi:hypothetical protein